MPANECQRCHSLKAACEEAFDAYPNSCSHAVWHVIKKYNPDQRYLTANALVVHLENSRQWEEVDIKDIAELADNGMLVIGGATDFSHGHVIVVYPGKPRFNGGFFFKGSKGKLVRAPNNSVYPLAMSTSMGTWPGAKSRGDKTVADPWPAAQFKNVRFWKYVGK